VFYVTTRVRGDTFGPNDVLNQDRGPGGGYFAPRNLPKYAAVDLRAMGKKRFSENVADVVNILFGTRLDGWTIEFAIGRYPVKILHTGNRTVTAEMWHNPAWRFERLARGVEKAIRQSDQICLMPTDWILTGSRIAVLFGIFGELISAGVTAPDNAIDVVIPAGDFSAPMACWYARKMGLPIHSILVCCNENAGAWSLLHKGEVRTDTTLIQTDTPLCDQPVPAGLERLLFETLGLEPTVDFLETVKRGSTFYLEPQELQTLRQGLYATVVSRRQMEAAVISLYGSNGYLADPYTALCYGGIGPYRSKSGESRTALILSEESPKYHIGLLAQILGTTSGELKKAIE